VVDLTKHLSKEETVALLEGDTLPVSIMLDCHSLPCRMRISIGIAVPGVLVVGREASRVGGLGDLAVVDLLKGVEALARDIRYRYSSFVGGFIRSRVRSFFHMNLEAQLAQKKRFTRRRSVPRLLVPEVELLGQLYQMPTTTLGTTLTIVYTTDLLNNKKRQCFSNR
jgi:hypothetical protein